MGDNNNYNYAYETEYGLCPSWALSLGYLGVASGAVLSNWGSAVSSFFMSVKKLFVGTILLCVCVRYSSIIPRALVATCCKTGF